MKAIIKKATRVLGDYELKYPLDCDGEIMGKEFKIHLDNVVGKILFPKKAYFISLFIILMRLKAH